MGTPETLTPKLSPPAAENRDQSVSQVNYGIPPLSEKFMEVIEKGILDDNIRDIESNFGEKTGTSGLNLVKYSTEAFFEGARFRFLKFGEDYGPYIQGQKHLISIFYAIAEVGDIEIPKVDRISLPIDNPDCSKVNGCPETFEELSKGIQDFKASNPHFSAFAGDYMKRLIGTDYLPDLVILAPFGKLQLEADKLKDTANGLKRNEQLTLTSEDFGLDSRSQVMQPVFDSETRKDYEPAREVLSGKWTEILVEGQVIFSGPFDQKEISNAFKEVNLPPDLDGEIPVGEISEFAVANELASREGIVVIKKIKDENAGVQCGGISLSLDENGETIVKAVDTTSPKKKISASC